ncbi:hypothetical protein [Clostridium sp.]|uniref:hypothetical protein n=1 Tax=Clostridium sp. TaxID=1506 RepID=UPI002841DAFC|nr:hypothetical protein [Clostridium sp.]MDR3596502.1 hypothetical protein [Clostridium sp.]
MKILLFGNIASGKTTLLQKLKEDISWPDISIDDYRRKYGNGSYKNELTAKKHFLEDIEINKNQFIECLGVGRFSKKLFSFICKSDEEIICIKLVTPKDICRSRLKTRIWDIPFPKHLNNVETLIDKTDNRLRRGDIEKLWSKRINTKIISKESINYMDLNQIAEEIKYLLKGK